MSVEDTYVIGFGTNDLPKSKLVRTITRGWCSHTWIEYYSIRFGAFWVIHATHTGVVRERVFDVWKQYPRFKRYEVKWDLSNGILRAGEYEGTPYDWRSTIVNAALLVMNDMFGYEAEIERDPERFNCSELSTSILKWSKIPKHERLDPEATYPIKLNRLVELQSDLFPRL